MSQGWTLTSRLIRARSEQMRQISSNSLRHIDRPSRSQSAIGGNECFPEIPTYPSHNKRLNPAQFVCSKMAYHVESKWNSTASSFKSCVFNVRPHSPASAGASRDANGQLEAPQPRAPVRWATALACANSVSGDPSWLAKQPHWQVVGMPHYPLAARLESGEEQPHGECTSISPAPALHTNCVIPYYTRDS